MLGLYLKSVIIYWIILFAAFKIAKINLKLQNINLKDYTNRESNGNLSTIMLAAVPVYRFAILLTTLFLCVASKEMLDKLFKKGE